MSPRYLCPSMGTVRRPASRDVTVLFNCCSRGFHASARQLEAQSGKDSPSSSSSGPQAGSNRRARNVAAVSQITSLQQRRPLPRTAGLAGGVFRGGSSDGVTDSSSPPRSGPPAGAKVLTPRKPLTNRVAYGRPGPEGAADSAPGPMVRAPSGLKTTRNGPPGRMVRGPNLRGRGQNSSSSNGGREFAPKKREKKPEGSRNPGGAAHENPKPEDKVNDGMLQHLLRLQRKEWDRVPYEPKYTKGSFAANELIHAGRELFRGDAPNVPVWGRLEKTLGVVGMHGAAGRLEVKRVVMEDEKK